MHSCAFSALRYSPGTGNGVSTAKGVARGATRDHRARAAAAAHPASHRRGRRPAAERPLPLDQLLTEAALAAAGDLLEPVFTASTDAGERREGFVRGLQRTTADTEHLGRTMLRLTLDPGPAAADTDQGPPEQGPAAADPEQGPPEPGAPEQGRPEQRERGGTPRRGCRKVEWIERALEPVAGQASTRRRRLAPARVITLH